MASFNSTSSKKSENMFVASLNSRKSDKVITWINLTDTFVRNVFAKDIKDVSAQEVQAKIGTMYDNDNVYLHITDRTAEIEVVDPTDF